MPKEAKKLGYRDIYEMKYAYLSRRDPISYYDIYIDKKSGSYYFRDKKYNFVQTLLS